MPQRTALDAFAVYLAAAAAVVIGAPASVAEKPDAHLRLRHADPHRDPLDEPFVFEADNRFAAPGGLAIRLVRDGDRVTGFRLDAGRVKNLLFDRVPE